MKKTLGIIAALLLLVLSYPVTNANAVDCCRFNEENFISVSPDRKQCGYYQAQSEPVNCPANQTCSIPDGPPIPRTDPYPPNPGETPRPWPALQKYTCTGATPVNNDLKCCSGGQRWDSTTQACPSGSTLLCTGDTPYCTTEVGGARQYCVSAPSVNVPSDVTPGACCSVGTIDLAGFKFGWGPIGGGKCGLRLPGYDGYCRGTVGAFLSLGGINIVNTALQALACPEQPDQCRDPGANGIDDPGQICVPSAGPGGLCRDRLPPAKQVIACKDGNPGINTAIGCIRTDFQGFISQVVGIGIGIGSGVAFLMLLFGSFKLVTAQGSPDAIAQGKEVITSAIIGLVFIVLSVTIMQIIGYDILGLGNLGLGG